MYDGYKIENYYRIIDNTVILSVDDNFDSDGEVTGENRTIYIFDKRDGSFIENSNKSDKVKAKMPNGKYDEYISVVNNYYEDDGNTKIDGIIGIACNLFDTISVSYIMDYYDNVCVQHSYLEKWDDNTYSIDDNDDHYHPDNTTIIKRENRKSSFELVTIDWSDEEDE